MTIISFQTITQIEIDTDTGRQRILKAFTKLLGEGNGANSKKKPKQATEIVEQEVRYL